MKVPVWSRSTDLKLKVTAAAKSVRGKQLEANCQSVIKGLQMSLKVNSIRWGATGECATITRNPELKPKLSKERQWETTAATANEPALKKRQVTTEKPGRVHHTVGDRMAGSDDEISSELPTRNRNGVHAEVSRRTDRRKSERP